MNYEISLNFLPLKEQEFEFTIYRTEKKGEKKELFGEDIYAYKLPESLDNPNSEIPYWISFSQKENFYEFSCKPEYNNKLTLHYLFYCLTQKVQSQNEVKPIIPPNRFRKMVYFLLEEHKQGKECLLLSPYYLSSEKKFGFIIDFRFLKDQNTPFDREVQRLSLSLDKHFKSNSSFYIDKYNKLKEFKNKFYSQIFPLQIGNKQIELESSLIKLSADTLKNKIYLVNNSKESNSQFTGIRDNGPFETLKTKITLLFFYKSEYKQFASDLAKALKGEKFSTFSGLKEFFRIPEIQIKGIEIVDKDFVKFVVNEIENNSSNNFIPIIILSKSDEDKYYRIKYEALRYKRAVQFVTLELLRNKDSLKWSVSNIGLQIFAKLGGVPWLVKSENHKALIIGIGQSHEVRKEDSKYKITKYFAYSVLVDSSGRYKEINSVGKYNKKEEYLKALSNHIKNTASKYINDFDHFVIHCPFKIRKLELEQIKNTIKELSNDKTFVMLKINTDNNYFGFNLKSNSLVPYESTYLQLSSNEFLVWFEGLQYHNPNINKRIAGPTHIEFYYSNKQLTIADKKSYLQDVLNLSGANWRGFNSKSVPISIHYTRLISKFIQNFSRYNEINIENIKPWFI